MCARSGDEAAEAWDKIITSLARVYFALQTGSRNSKFSQTWYQKRVFERRNDPLLLYMWIARNAEEHGLNLTTSRTLAVGSTGNQITIKKMEIVDGNIVTLDAETPDGQNVVVQEGLYLAPVEDKKGKTVQPPTAHLGKPLPDCSLATAAGLAIDYVTEMVADAATLV